MNRNALLERLYQDSEKLWDVIVIGGGATGAGIAVDACSRGFDTLLLEQHDFGKGTSSRSTKLLHGGVRYLAQGDLELVFEALRERRYLLKNAPHLTMNQQFLVPVYSRWQIIKYYVGLKFYDLLSGKHSLGKSFFCDRRQTLEIMPNLKSKGLKGSIIYHDGQFDDSRFLVSLIQTIDQLGGIALNYFKVTGLLKNVKGKICGVHAMDVNENRDIIIQGRVVINATGVFSDSISAMDEPVLKRTIRPSQGIHLVFDKKFLPGNTALMIPRTSDGRVLFAIPWYGKIIAGTTDTLIHEIDLEPQALGREIDFILSTASEYFTETPSRKDILTVYAGLRPLVASPDNLSTTRELSRKHNITISASGLVSVEGGKWTIYRRMAEDTMNKIMRKGLLEKRACKTKDLHLYGFTNTVKNGHFSIYGSHGNDIIKLIESDKNNGTLLHPDLPYTRAEIIWICMNEMPVQIEDILARRTRALFLNAKASISMSGHVAEIMRNMMGKTESWESEQRDAYHKLVKKYLIDD